MSADDNSGSSPKVPPGHHPNSLKNLKRIPKGSPSLNPGGRPKSVASQIREKTNNGQLIYEQMIRIWVGMEKGFGPRERMEAGKWLMDRGYGKETQTTVAVEASLEQIEEASEMSDAALESLARGLKVVDRPRPSDAPSAKDAATEETGLPLKVAK